VNENIIFVYENLMSYHIFLGICCKWRRWWSRSWIFKIAVNQTKTETSKVSVIPDGGDLYRQEF